MTANEAECIMLADYHKAKIVELTKANEVECSMLADDHLEDRSRLVLENEEVEDNPLPPDTPVEQVLQHLSESMSDSDWWDLASKFTRPQNTYNKLCKIKRVCKTYAAHLQTRMSNVCNTYTKHARVCFCFSRARLQNICKAI